MMEGESPVIGFLDVLRPPRGFHGWAKFRDGEHRPDARIVIRIGQEVVAEGKRTEARPDVKDVVQPVGFSLQATRDIADEEIARGLLSLELVNGGTRGPIVVAPRFAHGAALGLMLNVLSPEAGLDETAVQALSEFVERRAESFESRRRRLAILAVLHSATNAAVLADLADCALTGVTRASWRPGLASAPNLTDKEVLQHYESLGENCELGFVQRTYGYEPNSLLRWASAPFDKLMAMLRAEMAGVGDPEHTEFAPFWSNGEYALRDRRFDLISHTVTFEVPSEVYEREFLKHCKRMSWLARGFLEQLREPQRIWVRVDNAPLSPGQIAELFAELGRFGPNRLLIVRADPERDGQVERIEPGLWVGYVRVLARLGTHDFYAEPGSWMAMLRNVLIAMNAAEEIAMSGESAA